MRLTSALHNALDVWEAHQREGHAVVAAGLLVATPVAGGVGVEILGLEASHRPVTTIINLPAPKAPADSGSGLVERVEVADHLLRTSRARGLPDLYLSVGRVYSDGVPIL